MSAPGKGAIAFGLVCGGLIAAIIVGVLVIMAKTIWGYIL